MISERRPDFGNALEGFTQPKDLPEIQWRNPGETGGGHYEKQNALSAPG